MEGNAKLTPKTISPQFIIEGTRNKTTGEFVHIYSGRDDDKLGRTPQAQKAYMFKMLKICRELYVDTTFTVTERKENGEEILLDY